MRDNLAELGYATPHQPQTNSKVDEAEAGKDMRRATSLLSSPAISKGPSIHFQNLQVEKMGAASLAGYAQLEISFLRVRQSCLGSLETGFLIETWKEGVRERDESSQER